MDAALKEGLQLMLREEFSVRQPDRAVLAKSLKEACDVWRKMHTSCTALQWKVKKRRNPPQSAVDIMQGRRELVQEIWTLCLAVTPPPECIDVGKAFKTIDTLREKHADWFSIPLAFQASRGRAHV